MIKRKKWVPITELNKIEALNALAEYMDLMQEIENTSHALTEKVADFNSGNIY